MGGTSPEIIEAREEAKEYSMFNFQDLILIYSHKMEKLLKEAGGLESNLALTSDYWKLRNKCQFVRDKFTKV